MAIGFQGWRNDYGIPTPEFGVTEAIGSLFGQQPNSQGGSNLIGPAQPTITNFTNQNTTPLGPTYTPTTNTKGQTLGTTQLTNQTVTDPNQQYSNNMTNSINSGWDSYEAQLNDLLVNGLPSQVNAQNAMVNESATSGEAQLASQKQTGLTNLENTQTKSLKDLSSNISNLFQAGNVNLGARGSGDSSAVNQYSYAIGKMGTKARGDIMSQMTQRRQNLEDVYNSEFNKIESDKRQQLNNIQNWFIEQSNAVKAQVGSAGLNRQKDIQSVANTLYTQGVNMINQINQDALAKRQTLMNWANYNSTSMAQASQYMQQLGIYTPTTNLGNTMPSVSSEGNYQLPVGAGSTSTTKKDIFGNPIP